jgi:N-carbamoyl-L-amino-acid hydrolase
MFPEPVSHSYEHRSIPNWLASSLEAAEYPGYFSRYMVSGPGHDCNYINQVAPAAMIFVPVKGGRSHVEVDESNWDDCEKGVNVPLHVMLKSDNEK